MEIDERKDIESKLAESKGVLTLSLKYEIFGYNVSKLKYNLYTSNNFLLMKRV